MINRVVHFKWKGENSEQSAIRPSILLACECVHPESEVNFYWQNMTDHQMK
mgnify:CR=1 FL=1